MDDIIKIVLKILPTLKHYEFWVKCMVAIWIILTAFIIVILIFGKRNSNLDIHKEKWAMTGDEVIDGVLVNLNEFEAKGMTKVNESDLISTLKPLFTRPAFYGIREENFRYFLFALCKSRLILEYYMRHFKSYEITSKLDKAIQLMVKLQNDTAKIYGPSFSISESVNRYIDNKATFIDNLPAEEYEKSVEFYNNRDLTITEIRTTLRSIGLSN